MRNLQITQSITDHESTIVEYYFQEISKLHLITAEEEASLSRKIKQGDQSALNTLIKANLRFVVSVAKKYQNQGLAFADLISEGNAGLIKAAQRFDETKGFRFISFAVWWIRQSIMFAIAEQTRMIRLPMNQINLLTKMKKSQSELEQSLERRPETLELAGFMNTEEKKISDAFLNSARTESYDVPFKNADNCALIDQLKSTEPSADELLDKESNYHRIQLLLSNLTKGERAVIELNFGLKGTDELSPQDIAENIGVTTERVRQLRRSGITKMKGIVNSTPSLFH